MNLEARLKSFLTKAQYTHLHDALAIVEKRTGWKEPPSTPEPAKVQEGWVCRHENTRKFFARTGAQWVDRAENATIYANTHSFMADCGDIRDVQPVSVFNDGTGWKEVKPDPAPERDRHGRLIVARNDFAMIVRTDEPEDDLPYLIVDSKSEFYWCYNEWIIETMIDLPRTGFLHKNQAIRALPLAARTPLPDAKPVEPTKPDMWEHLQDMGRLIDDLEDTLSCRISKLEDGTALAQSISTLVDANNTLAKQVNELEKRIVDLERKWEARESYEQEQAERQ